MNAIETIRKDFTDLRAKLEALPDDGAVLFCDHSALAISIPEGNADAGHAAGLIFATVFTDADRRAGANTPGLDRRYSDGANRPFMLTAMTVAKRVSLERLDAAIRALPMVEGA